MDVMKVNNNYTYDYLHGTDIYLYQRKDMFRINTDTALLANFMQVKANEAVLDIGTNNGALLLAAASKGASKLIGIEIQKEACELAKINLERCQVPFEIIEGDVSALKMPNVHCVVCNPPYFPTPPSGNRNQNEALCIARHEKYLSFETLCQKAAQALQTKGRFYLVHRSDRLGELISTLYQNRFCVSQIQFVYDPMHECSTAVLIEAIKDGKRKTKVLPSKMIER